MSEPDRTEAMRDAARDALRELIPDLIHDLLRSEQGDGNGNGNGNGTGNGHAAEPEPDIVPLVPAPPVAAVLRPSTWSGPAVAGEVIGGDGSARPAESVELAEEPRPPAPSPSAPAPPSAPPLAAGGTVETVRIDNDEDLQTFVRTLAGRLANPRDRLAIKSGRLRFALQRGAPAGTSEVTPAEHAQEVVRVQRGAVTERHVRDAASRGARLVVVRGAVLTPLARDTARSLGVQIEKEGKC
jgi:hypothetical protein